MEPGFITYRKFDDVALANELARQLETHHIPHKIEEESLAFDPSYAFSPLARSYAVKIRSDDFERVNQLLKEDESEDVNQIGRDYYLFSFTNVELMEVINKSDEWSPFDVVLARKILAEEGIDINEKAIAEINKKRIEELKAPDPPQTAWIVIGYICAILGGILGMFIGWYIANGKKTLPDGEQVYYYRESDRKQGRMIFYLSIVAFALWALYKFGILSPA